MKNQMLMQIYVDVPGKRIRLEASDQAAALGSAVYAILAVGKDTGWYEDYRVAVKHMSGVKEQIYEPQPEYVKNMRNGMNCTVDSVKYWGWQPQSAAGAA